MGDFRIVIEYCEGGVLAHKWLVTSETGTGDDETAAILGATPNYHQARAMAAACYCAIGHAQPDRPRRIIKRQFGHVTTVRASN